MAPRSRKGEAFVLDRRSERYGVGRSLGCALRLSSAQASRDHAEIELGDDGRWVVRARPGKRFTADDEVFESDRECELCEGLSLVFGQDRFRVRKPEPVVDVTELPGDTRTRGALLVAAGVLAAALVILVGSWLVLR